ncbi:MAG TPA: hypothetical protein VJI97_03240 [Candidatus Nanoarchaeia archaeon]|nr:hypothetical protein [Candidatus Nanoarchaeia archaeon]
MNSKKGFTMAEALMRIIIAVVLLFIVFKFGKGIADSLFGGGDALQSFESLANEMNSQDNWIAKPTLLSLDEGTGVIGFSRIGDFQCMGCAGDSKDSVTSIFKRPQAAECAGNACLCVCTNGLKINIDKSPSETSCENIYCKAITQDIYPSYNLKDGKFKTYNGQTTSSWKNGFIFVRDIDNGDTGDRTSPSGMSRQLRTGFIATGYLSNSQRTVSLQIEKKASNGVSYTMVCPESPCIQQQN